MTEQIPSTEPATDGAPATEYPVVAGAGESFDALDSSIPLSADAGSSDADSSDADQGDAGPGDDGPSDGAAPAGG